MKSLLPLSTVWACLLLLAGCTSTPYTKWRLIRPYHPPVQQGNIITSTMVAQLHHGLTKQEVVQILGGSVLESPLPQQWHYVHTFRPAYGPTQKSLLILTFKNDILVNIDRRKFSNPPIYHPHYTPFRLL